MRAAISLFITGLLFSSLAVINNQAPDIQVSNSESQELMAAIGNTKRPRKDWRGSGRKQLVQQIKSTHPLV
ncbi:hypothetical protein [Brasilonema sp. UFV-L1]|uniref:heterocyst-inhibiting protein PatX n=1 Tax=Brasilonema sp. UFV-L1 TaxID=2234130 RepID=UPI00145D060A|nr:hypothetical protein [Brasilonema sp. UFV-L1]NMG07878.1 hypothetical protein [Brasilonema sp. UFV-L1]